MRRPGSCSRQLRDSFWSSVKQLCAIRQLEPAIFAQLPDSDSIVRFRNLLVHAYDQIDSKRVYAIATEDLPAFVPVLTQLVAEAEAQGL
ncbi:MAG: HepT-like ribonuclease domain-containing protein [Fimbriimonadales bacterium]